MRRLFVTLGILGLVLAAAPQALAAPVAVDPSTLTPPPPGSFDSTCVTQGSGAVCTGTEIQTFVDLDLGASGFACDGHAIIDNGQQVREGRFVYDAQGRATSWFTRGTFREDWMLDGVPGAPTLTTHGQWSVKNEFDIPGDITSRTRAYRGENLAIHGPGGLVSHDPGLRIFDWDESTVLVHHGPGTDFDTFIGAVCAAFGV
jgi:hypothetical protein